MLNTKSKLKFLQDTGFSTKGTSAKGRFINKDGTPNIEKRGLSFWKKRSPYHTLIAMPIWKFLMVIIGFYIIINLFFAGIYFSLGVEHLQGIKLGNALHNFAEAFFFSAQTFTTVGYGRISPDSFTTSAIAAFEAMIGLLTFAIATGLFYARFSQPRAFLQFAEKAVIAPYKGGAGLMFRVAPQKNNNLTDAEVRATMGIRIKENHETVSRFYALDLEITKINALILSWTIVHPIHETSPLFGISENDLAQMDAEIIILVRAFDDAFSNTVVSRTSYLSSEIEYGAQFVPMFYPNDQKPGTILDLSKIDQTRSVPVNTKVKPE
jgi:inward rectifier potassium channel